MVQWFMSCGSEWTIEDNRLTFYTLLPLLAGGSSRCTELKENAHSHRQSIGVGEGGPSWAVRGGL